MSDPWLSVIMPTFNGAAYLSEALRSVDAQKEDQVEVIAVDDGSTDATLSILRAYACRLPVRIIERGRIGNWVANSNYGLAQARGRYACFLHQDDLWLPGRLQLLRRLVAQEPQATLFFHACRYIDTRGSRLGVWRGPVSPGRLETDLIVEQLLVQNFIAMPAPMFDREAALDAGGLDESLWYTADWDFWIKLAQAGPTVYHPTPLAAFRIHPRSQTARGVARAAEMRKQMESVLNRHLPRWESAHPGRFDVGQAARMSMELNHALAVCAYGERPNWLALAGSFLVAWPGVWRRFLRDSRILERLPAQLRARAGGVASGYGWGPGSGAFPWPEPGRARRPRNRLVSQRAASAPRTD